MSEPDPLTVDLDALPLQPQRWMYVLPLILRRHNWQHAAKAKGVSHRTNEARACLCIWVFRFLRDNRVKTFKLDPRSFSGRYMDLTMRFGGSTTRQQPKSVATGTHIRTLNLGAFRR